jgi:predicted DNA-binding protein
MKLLAKKATVYLEPDMHRVLKIKAAETSRSISDLVNEAVRQSFVEDAEDIAVFEERAGEPLVTFEDVLKDLKRSGRI